LLWILLAANSGTVPTAAATTPETIIVTGSRVATEPADIPASVTVLTRADFDVEKPAKVGDLLRRVAGVHVDQVGGRGGTGSLYLRGADPNYTLVLVDGVRVNDPTNARGGSFDFSLLDVADIERVEIARGPYSAVYGGDALAGVINIVTRQARRESTRVAVDAWAGAYDTREVALSAAGPLGNGSWNVGASDTNEGAQFRGNDFESQRVSGGVDFEFGETQVFATGRYSESERAGFPDDSGGYGFAAIRDPETRDASEAIAGIGVNTRVGDATFGLTMGFFDRDDHIDSPGVAPGVRDPFGVPPSLVDTSLTRYSATLTGTQKFSDLLTMAYGVDWLREQGESIGTLDFGGGFLMPTNFELTRTTWAPFVEMRLSSSFGLSSQIGVRVDNFDGQGGEGESSVTSPRVRVAYELADTGFTVAGAWGKAFKLPSLYALGHPLVGNPTLSPERGESREIELSQTLLDGKARWSATWFDGEFRNAIDFDPGPPPMLVNRNRVDTKGVELAGRFKANEQWQIDGSVTHATSEVASSGNQLRNRPEWRGGVGAHFSPLSTLRFSASATYVGNSLDSSIATGDVRISSYTRLDASAVWQVSDNFEAFVAVDNLTDEQYEEFIGNEVRGILPRAGVRLSF
jgi:outer membrane cobalamin receptor